MFDFIFRNRVATLFLLVMLYGLCLILLQTIASDLVTVLLAVTIAVMVVAAAWNLWEIRYNPLAGLWRLLLLLIGFYKSMTCQHPPRPSPKCPSGRLLFRRHSVLV